MRVASLALATSLAVAQHAAAASTAPPSTEPGAGMIDLAPAPVTVDVLRETFTLLFAPSNDLLNPLTAFGIEPPKGVPVPDGAFVYHISGSLIPSPDGGIGGFDVLVDLVTAVPAQELVAVVESAMTRNGFPLVGEYTEDIRNDGVATFLEFGLSGTLNENSLTVGVLDFGPGSFTGVFVSVRGPVRPDDDGLTAWLAGLPMIEQASEPPSVAFEAERDERGTVRIVATAAYMFEITGRELRDQFEAALPASDFAIVGASARPGALALRGGELDELEVMIDRLGGPGRLTANATIHVLG